MKKGQKKCQHRYKGIYGLYVPRGKVRIIDGQKYQCVYYQCQIKGCSHWKINSHKHKFYKSKEVKKMKKKPTTKILEIVDKIPNWRIERIAKAIDGFELNKTDSKIVVGLISIQAEKEELTGEEIETNLKEILTLFVLEDFQRKGLVKRNKQGIYSKTKLGREVMKSLDEEERNLDKRGKKNG